MGNNITLVVPVWLIIAAVATTVVFVGLWLFPARKQMAVWVRGERDKEEIRLIDVGSVLRAPWRRYGVIEVTIPLWKPARSVSYGDIALRLQEDQLPELQDRVKLCAYTALAVGSWDS